jgi:hypothetical protein
MKRLRYHKQDDGTFKTEPITTPHEMVVATIYPTETAIVWNIVGENQNILGNGTGLTKEDSQRKIKAKLRKLGAIIFDEVRKSKNGGGVV